MDAKERLRLYLEQRRDAGESELVLDSLSVDDVMRLLGARGATRAPVGESAVERPGRQGAAPDRAVPLDAAADRGRAAGDPSSPPASSGDWREALRALDARPGGERAAAPIAGERPAASRPPVPRTDSERAPAPVPPAPQAPSVPPLPAAPPARVAAAGLPPEAGARAGDPPATRAASATGDAGGASHATMPLEQVPAGLVVGSPAHELFGGPESPYATLDDIARAAQSCERCALHRTARQAVPGVGNPQADFVCVGEAPGANEDEQGVPFVGQAGQLLTKILGAIQLSREEVFICNVLKHRPPGNRNPLPEEVAACSPFLVRQIELLAPKVIVALGTFAAQTLLQTKEPIGKLRGKIHRYYGVPLIVTYHPAALLRNPSWKRPTWEDVQLARRLLDRARGP